MDFDFTDEQNALREAVARWADKAYPFERRQTLVRAGGASRPVLAELAELGLCGLTVPEDAGGLGFGAVEAMVVLEALGQGLVHVPYAALHRVAPALLDGCVPPVRQRWLPAVAEGRALVAPALHEHRGRHRPEVVHTVAHNTAEGWKLTGVKSVVPAADEADAFVVTARVSGAADDPQGIVLFVVEAGTPGVRVQAYPTHDGARAGELHLNGAVATQASGIAGAEVSRAHDIGVASACAEAVGVMDRLVRLTAEYLNTRRQFGVPIASFQALRHRMADVKMQLELARSMSYYATLRLDAEESVRRRALSQAKVQVGQGMRFVGQQCIQLHGGIGVTDEYIASHAFKRLTVLEMAWGDTLHHLGEVSDRMTDTAGVFS